MNLGPYIPRAGFQKPTAAAPAPATYSSLLAACDAVYWPAGRTLATAIRSHGEGVRKAWHDGTLASRRDELYSTLIAAHVTFRDQAGSAITALRAAVGESGAAPWEMVLHSVANAIPISSLLGQALQHAHTNHEFAILSARFDPDAICQRARLTEAEFRSAFAAPFVARGDSVVRGSDINFRKEPLQIAIGRLHAMHRELTEDTENVGARIVINAAAQNCPIPHEFVVSEVLSECLANAMRAMRGRRGEVGVVVKLVELNHVAGITSQSTGIMPPRKWSVLIADSGVGMTEEQLAKLRSGTFTTKPQGGKGVQLNKIAIEDLLGGTFSVRSIPNKGTAVRITFPHPT